ncbi:MAG TPA: cupin domain-containing protein [Acidobacteriaceae bacterium]
MNRREMMTAMAAFSMMAAAIPEASAQGTGAAEFDLSRSRVYRFDEMKVTPNKNGGWSRAILHGTLPTGEVVESHQTMLPPGQMPHPPHKHRNSEFVLIREGKLEYLNDGKPEPAGAGDVIFTASNVMHGLKNVGTTNALYFIVSISSAQG